MDKETLEAQRIAQTMQQGPPPQPVSSTQSACPECGLIHPPLPQGQKCPNAPLDKNDMGIDDADVNKHLVDMRNIIMSKMRERGVKDGKKFFQYAVIELTKALENYNE